MKKHFELDITDTTFSFARKTTEIAAEAATDGIYVVRTSVPQATLDDADTVRSYKSLSLVERAFRCIKTVDLHVRPVYHWLADRVRAHVFLCIFGRPPPCKVFLQCFDQIACVHMSGLFVRSRLNAGQDGFRDESSKQ